MNNIDLRLDEPRWLLLLIPLVGLSLIPFFRLPRYRRRTRGRVVSLILHTLILLLSVSLLVGVGLRTERRLDTFDVILLADLSESHGEAVETMNQRIHAILSEEHAKDFRIGIVTFAEDGLCVAELRADPDRVYRDYIGTDEPLPADRREATDLASALYYAKGLLGEVAGSRLILLSDGLETDGDAVQAAAAIAEEGVRVYAIPTEHEGPRREVQLDRLEVEDELKLDETAKATLTLRSATPGIARLVLYDNGDRCAERTVTLTGGTDTLTLDYTPTAAGLHELCLRVETDGESDTLTQNNTVYAYAYIDIAAQVLLVDGTGTEAAAARDILSEDCTVTVISPGQFPRSLDDLKTYSEVILMNVSMLDLPDGADELLNTYVYDFGGGLLTTGGRNTYTLGCMAGTRFDDMLPIDMDDDDTHVLELMIVMDRSISMEEPVAGTDLRRIDLAKQGAIDCCNTLKDSDFIGIITFCAITQMQWSLTPATNRNAVIRSIEAIDTYPATLYYKAFSLAQTELFASKNRADKQHIIFISDGDPQDRGYLDIVRSMASRGITVSVIGISPDRTVQKKLSAIAEAGNGRCYFVTKESMLPDIMRMETLISQRELINEGTVQPQYKDYSPVITGIDRLPALEGYIGVGVKPEAKAVYTVGADPIYAEWQYGAGKVGSFMSDLGGDWSKTFAEAENGQRFLRNTVRHLERDLAGSAESGELEVEFEPQNHTTLIHVNKSAEAGHTVVATVTAPDGTVSQAPLDIVGVGGYTGHFDTRVPGVYTVLVEETDADGAPVAAAEAFVTFSYSAEYDAFVDPLTGYEKLDAICRTAGGHLLLPDERIFTKESMVITRDRDLTLPLLIALILLFLLDIAARKFRFKWPHEWGRRDGSRTDRP